MGQFMNFRTVNSGTRRHLPPREADSGDALMVLGFVAVLALLLLLRKVVGLRELRHAREAIYQHIRDACRERGLDENDSGRVVEAVRKLDMEHPHQAVTSSQVFDQVVAPEIRKKDGGELASKVRTRFFEAPPGPSAATEPAAAEPPGRPAEHAAAQPPPAEDPESHASTRELDPGQEVHVRFAGLEESLACVVLNVDRKSFILALPETMRGEPAVGEGETARGFFHRGEQYYHFATEVLDVIGGGVLAVTLRHAENCDSLERRTAARVEAHAGLRFYHFAPEALRAEAAEPGTDDVMHRGRLQDLSAGGCALVTKSEPGSFSKGDYLRFPIRLFSKQEPVQVLGEIRDVEPASEEGEMRTLLRVKFLGLSEEVRNRLAHVVHEILIREHEGQREKEEKP